MDAINSVSKGIFIFKNGKSLKELRKKKTNKVSQHEFENEVGYLKFKAEWVNIEARIEKIQSESYGKILSSLLTFIQNIDFTATPNLQTAVLLTGVNQTDHLKQFGSLSQQISNNCPSIITILQSRDCPNIKSAVECLVSGMMSQCDDELSLKLKKNQMTMPVLEAWFRHNHGSSEVKPSLVIMVADFEQFNTACIQDLITILCSYTNRLPIVLVLGIATAFKTLHNVLPSHITNKIDANVFQSESSTVMLNKILEEVVLVHHSPFQLSGKSFKILMDIFLFYDYSLHSFIKGYKVFMMEHLINHPVTAVMRRAEDLKGKTLRHEDLDYIRRNCLSFRKYVESEPDPEVRIELIENDEFLRLKLSNRIRRVERYWSIFYCFLRVLVVLLDDLPRNDLGKLLRELYPICVSSDITKLDEYKECFKLLRFTSKDKFIAKLDKILALLDDCVDDVLLDDDQKKNAAIIRKNLDFHRQKIENACMSPQKDQAKATPTTPNTPSVELNKKGGKGRQEMMEKLKESAKNNPTRVLIEYERYLCECLEYLNKMMEKYLQPVHKAPAMYEFSVFTDCQAVRRQIVGAPRGALHNALSNPQHYLQCPCCVMPEDEQILPTLPDISIAYKLHLECNKFINLYDWLQAFAMVIELKEDEEISPEIQARFTRAIAELQFLGMIKQAKQKTDTVARLTW